MSFTKDGKPYPEKPPNSANGHHGEDEDFVNLPAPSQGPSQLCEGLRMTSGFRASHPLSRQQYPCLPPILTASERNFFCCPRRRCTLFSVSWFCFALFSHLFKYETIPPFSGLGRYEVCFTLKKRCISWSQSQLYAAHVCLKFCRKRDMMLHNSSQ